MSHVGVAACRPTDLFVLFWCEGRFNIILLESSTGFLHAFSVVTETRQGK